MRKIIRRTAGMKKEIGAALVVALQLITLTLIGLMAPFLTGPQHSADSAGASQVSATDAQTAQPPTATVQSDRRASAIAATKLSGLRATEVFNLATTRAASASQSELPNEATLTTDQEDYQPYIYVYITGTGFAPGETVNMIVVQLSPNPASYEPWDVVADANGNIDTSWYIFSEDLIRPAQGRRSGEPTHGRLRDRRRPPIEHADVLCVAAYAYAFSLSVRTKSGRLVPWPRWHWRQRLK